MPAWYATVEELSRVLGVKSTAYSDADLRRAVSAGSADVDDVAQWTGGAFRPIRATYYFDWPARQTTTYYKLWLDALPLISVEMLVAGGAVISPANYNLEPNQYGPPYKRIELNRGTSAAFSYSGGTPQRAIGVLGLWGIGDDREAAGTVVGALGSSDATATCSDGSLIGTGDHLVIDTERIEVTGKSWVGAATLDTGGLASSVAGNTIPLTGGAVSPGELLLVDSERMLVVDVAGTTYTVKRAQDGTTLAAHTAGATVYARRGLLLTRGARGTLAGGHSPGTAISKHVVPGDVSALCIASAITTHLRETTAYAKDPGPKGTPSMFGDGIDVLRDRVAANYGRQVRTRVI